MLEKTKQLLIVLLLALSCGLAAFTLRWERDTAKRTDAILTHVDAVAARAQRTMEKIEAASMRQKEVGDRTMEILDDMDADVKSAKAAIDQSEALLGTSTQEVRSFGAQIADTNFAVQQMIEDAKRALHPIPELLVDTDKTVNSANAVIASPDIPVTLHEVSQAAGDMHGTTANLNDTSRDVKNYVHRATQPSGVVKSIFLKLLSPVATFFATHF